MYNLKIALVLLLVIFVSFIQAEEKISHPNLFANNSDPNAVKVAPIHVLSIVLAPDVLTLDEARTRTHSEKKNLTHEKVLVLINDNPVTFFLQGMETREINQYLKPGQNTIGVKGRHQKELWVEVNLCEEKNMGTFTRLEEVDTILEETIRPSPKTHEWQGSFEVDISYELPIFEKSNQIPKDKNLVKEQAIGFLKHVHDTLDKYDVSEIKQLRSKGQAVWQKLAYKRNNDEINEFYQAGIEILKEAELSEFDKDALKLVYGSNLIMAYTKSKPYTWLLQSNNGELYLGPLILAYINNEWVCWQ